MNQSGNRNIWMDRRHCIALALALGISGPWGMACAQNRTGPVLVLGDSLSAEYGLNRGKGWVKLLEQRLQTEKTPRAVVNASISGDTTSGGRARLPALLSQHQPSIVILELGGNDALRGLALQSSQSNLDAMIKASQDAGAQVLLVGMQVPPNYGASYTEQFAQMFQSTASRHKLSLLPFLLAGFGDAPDAMQWFQADRIHPNAQAQPLMLNNVWPRLQPLLK
ncbi:MAG: arylesterase [Comamonas sp.]|jgi:acyl-CoA thioesterase-1|uniref:arylesterase n=1 Tax=Comamonas sp. TaxID=34028 RepID=UPI0028194BBC|nr:arylesterase [Comamonas sp.]MDR0212398.1 arylesterase [Comamonas sp.]